MSLLHSLATTCTQILPPPFSPGQLPRSLLFPPCLLMCPPLAPPSDDHQCHILYRKLSLKQALLTCQLPLFTSPCHLTHPELHFASAEITRHHKSNVQHLCETLSRVLPFLPPRPLGCQALSSQHTLLLISIIALVTLYYLDLFSEPSPQSELLEGRVDILLILVSSA